MQFQVPLAKVLVGISCSNLISADFLSKSDPQVSVKEFDRNNNQWIEIYKTEKIMNNLSPTFKEFEMNYFFESLQLLKFEVYDIDNHKKDYAPEVGDFLGKMSSSLAELVRNGQTKIKLKDFQEKEMKSGFIAINVRQVDSRGEEIQLSFSASNVPQKGVLFKKDSSTSLMIEAISHSRQWTEVYFSPAVKDSSNPLYSKFKMKLSSLSLNGQPDDKIRISICKHDKKTSIYGTVLVRIGDLIHSAKTQSKNSWTVEDDFSINLEMCRISKAYTFIDYIQDNLDINLTVAIDFTASNGDPRTENSLHFLGGNENTTCNDYTRAIEAIGRVLEEYDTDKMFPVYGFGAKTPPEYSVVKHCFPLSHENCRGIDGILAAYKNCLPQVQLYGPTNFEPVIRQVIKLASETSQNSKLYFVLLIITDGVITDLEKTVEAIIEASELPVSIIIVGVGNACFDAMDFLDSDDRLLRSRDGLRVSGRDIVQFVPFNKFRLGSVDQLAKHVLAELPSQVTEYFSSKGIYPNI